MSVGLECKDMFEKWISEASMYYLSMRDKKEFLALVKKYPKAWGKCFESLKKHKLHEEIIYFLLHLGQVEEAFKYNTTHVSGHDVYFHEDKIVSFLLMYKEYEALRKSIVQNPSLVDDLHFVDETGYDSKVNLEEFILYLATRNS